MEKEITIDAFKDLGEEEKIDLLNRFFNCLSPNASVKVIEDFYDALGVSGQQEVTDYVNEN